MAASRFALALLCVALSAGPALGDDDATVTLDAFVDSFVGGFDFIAATDAELAAHDAALRASPGHGYATLRTWSGLTRRMPTKVSSCKQVDKWLCAADEFSGRYGTVRALPQCAKWVALVRTTDNSATPRICAALFDSALRRARAEISVSTPRDEILTQRHRRVTAAHIAFAVVLSTTLDRMIPNRGCIHLSEACKTVAASAQAHLRAHGSDRDLNLKVYREGDAGRAAWRALQDRQYLTTAYQVCEEGLGATRDMTLMGAKGTGEICDAYVSSVELVMAQAGRRRAD
jgi:hypothetical protein